MTETVRPLPEADSRTGLEILKGLARERSLLTAMILMHRYVGRAFRVTLPRFQPAVFIGPESNRQILVTERGRFLWRPEGDPVTRLLRRGVLVVDGEEHDRLRGLMEPALQRPRVLEHIPAFWRYTDQVIQEWRDGETRDMLVEMRRIALLILMGTVFEVDFAPDMDRMWGSILHLLEYISPGLWIVWPDMPRPRYRRAIQEMDDYLYGNIRRRREDLVATGRQPNPGDLLGRLVAAQSPAGMDGAPGMDDDLIRDQLLTMLIAGHDTSTASLSWTLYLLGRHPDALARAQAEVDSVLPAAAEPPSADQLGRLAYLDLVFKEALRMYPPIHVGNRRTTQDMAVAGYQVPEGTRVMYSIYLSHRDREYWPEPERFLPERFERGQDDKRPPLTYVPFGGGPRNCIGAAFAQIEAKVVLSRILQVFDLQLLNGNEVRPYMGATLEPRPGVKMRIRRRA
jgi:cytochrome P450